MQKVPESDEVRMDEWYRNGADFRWCWPHLDRMTAASKRTRLMLNRYPYNVIGVAFYVRGHGIGIRWKDSR